MNLNLMTVSLEHSKTPWQTLPSKGLIGLYPSSALAKQLYDQDDDSRVKALVREGSALIPVLDYDVEFTQVSRWHPTLLQSWPGYGRAMRQFTVQFERQDMPLRLVGD